MRCRTQLAVVAALALCASSTLAETITTQGVKLDVPAGWRVGAAATPNSMRLKTPDGAIDVTVFVHRAPATNDADLGDLAEKLLRAEHQAQLAYAKQEKLKLAHYKSHVTRDGEHWFAHSALGWTNGVELRGVTRLERGKALSVGAESATASQAAMGDAIHAIMSRLRE
jgi:hypothetical protein